MVLDDIREIVNRNHLLSKYDIDRIGIFGSMARGEEGNDIDILIDDIKEYDEIIKFKEELEKMTNKRVDVMFEKYANPIVLYRAKKEIVYVSEY